MPPTWINFKLLRITAAIALLFATGSLRAQWKLTQLSQPGAGSVANAGSGDQVVGADASHATIWSAATNGAIADLHPTGNFVSSSARAVNQGRQGGSVTLGGSFLAHAALWSGTASSFVDLHPAGYPAALGSFVSAMSSTQQAGFASPTGGTPHALLWTGTPGSVVDLHPAGFIASQINAMSETQQGGMARLSSGNRRAILWSGAAANFINLHAPIGGVIVNYTDSEVYAMTATQQGGVYSTGGTSSEQAAMWSGTPETRVILHPTASFPAGTFGHSSRVLAMAGNFQAGQVDDRAAVWTGTAASYQNLHTLVVATLGSDYTISAVKGAYIQDGSVFLVGSATDTVHSRTVALMWSVPSLPQIVFNDAGFNDGHPYILWQNPSTGQRGIWIMNGTTVSGYVALDPVGPPWQIAAAADFNGDGKTDILWQNPATGQRGVWIMNGTVVSNYVALDPVGPPWQIVAAADFNGDGKPDILWQNPQTGQRGVWIMNGTSIVTYVALDPVGPPWNIAGAADFNGDGKTDIIWENPQTGQRGIWIMNGTTVSGYVALDPVGPPWQIAGAADFNNDGKPDILWQNPDMGQRGIWTMNGTVVSNYVALDPVGPPWQMRR